MSEQDTVPTARMHWARLVLGGGHPIIIIIVLTLVGLGICWYSLQKISSITQTPTRYVMQVEVNTEGCDDLELGLLGNISSSGASLLGFRFFDDDSVPVLGAGCWLRSLVLSSNLALRPFSYDDRSELVRIVGGDLDAIARGANGSTGPIDWDDIERTEVTVVDGALREIEPPDLTGAGPSFAIRGQEDEGDPALIDFRRSGIHYEVAFEEEWQPIDVAVAFEVPENVRTFFHMWGHQVDRDVPEDEGDRENQDVPEDEAAGPTSDEPTYSALDIKVGFRTDEVSLVYGMMSDSGNAESIGGEIRFGLENNDAESRRESGNVRYSAVLGIGIALIVEAFVILLAIGVRALAARLGFVAAGRAVDEGG